MNVQPGFEMGKKRVNGFLVAAGILIFTLIFVSGFGFWSAIHPQKISPTPITPASLGLDFENVQFVTSDKIPIRGWLVKSSSPQATRKVIIVLHGYPANKTDVLSPLAFLAKRYDLLFFDFRYLGTSGGSYTSIGMKEVEDLKSAVSFLQQRKYRAIGIFGVSMGGATALMAAPDLPDVKAIVADSSYASLGLMTFQFYKEFSFLKYPLAFLTKLWAEAFFGKNVDKTSPMSAAKLLKIPIFIIHSRADTHIPFAQALLLKQSLENDPKAEFWFMDGREHGETHLEKEFEPKVLGFFERYV